jgi:tRNA A-37 threonylcarbamoyl transferase component Bud32
VAALEVRLRVTSPELLSLPWRRPLADWDPTTVALRDIPVGPSRHLVRFVEADRRLWALKALPRRVAVHEYDVLRIAESRALAAVRTAGVVVQPTDDDAVLVTNYLERSWQYRRLLMRIAPDATVHRARLFDAMASLLVDLHRSGIFWGDCSLANTLFTRDGQVIQAWMVDAETAESHPSLSDGQRAADLEIMEENVAGGLVDVAARRGELDGAHARALAEATSIADRYTELWALLHARPSVGGDPSGAVTSRVRDLEEVGFAVDEVRLEAEDDEDLRLTVAVGGRRFHAEQFRALTGLDVGEGQARILLSDLRDHRAEWESERAMPVPESLAAHEWLLNVFTPGAERAHAAVHHHGDPVQAYCDLLEVRWILSEQAGHDVGDEPALDALARRATPGGSAAEVAFVDLPTEELPALTPNLLADLGTDGDELP